MGLTIATWSFLGGGATALFVGARAGIAAIVIGNLIDATLVALVSANPECEPMHRFVSQVAASKYTEGLFPTESMHTLILSQVSEYEWGFEVLRADFDCSEQKFRFEYFEQLWVSPAARNREQTRVRWNRKKGCGSVEGFAAFERFLALKKWFPGAVGALCAS